MTKLCICQICTCGRHRCPHHPQRVVNKSGQPCLLTEYANKYKQYPIEPQKSYKPVHEPQQNAGPLEDKTTHRTDYIKHPLEKPFVHQSDQYIKPEGNIDSLTSYKKDYTEKPINPSKAVKRDLTRKSPGKFDGIPTYTNDYRKWAIDPRNRVVHDPGYEPPTEPFQGESTFTRDFIPYRQAPRQMMKPAENANMSDEPFADKTGYREEYIKHPLPPKEAKEKAKWSPNKAPLDGLSTYVKDYPGKQAPKQPTCKPDANAYQSNAPFEDGTTQRTDYKKWPAERPYVHEPDTYMKPEGDMDLHTTTHLHYTKKPLERQAPRKAPEARKAPGRFDGTTNYNEDYRKWQPGEKPKITMRADYVPPEAPFQGNPTYTTDYIKYNVPPRQMMKPDDRAQMSDEPFADRTGYRDDYIKHKLEPKEKKERPKWEPNKTNLDGLTTYNRDYIEKQGPKQPSCKPDANPYQSDAPFEDDTTQRVDFKKWPNERPFVHEPDQYIKPEGDFDFHTTHGIEYTKKPLQKSVAKRPSSRKGVPGKFDGTTNYKEDYRKWQPGEKPKITMRADYAPPDAPFEGLSNYTTDYIKHRMDPSHSMKPLDDGYNSGAPFEGDTMYRTDYTKKKLPPCPAAILETGASGYKFAEQDPTTGHKFYTPRGVAVSITELPRSSSNMRVKSAERQHRLTALSVA